MMNRWPVTAATAALAACLAASSAFAQVTKSGTPTPSTKTTTPTPPTKTPTPVKVTLPKLELRTSIQGFDPQAAWGQASPIFVETETETAKPDKDGDGVPDDRDKCIDSSWAKQPDARVGPDGCSFEIYSPLCPFDDQPPFIDDYSVTARLVWADQDRTPRFRIGSIVQAHDVEQCGFLSSFYVRFVLLGGGLPLRELTPLTDWLYCGGNGIQRAGDRFSCEFPTQGLVNVAAGELPDRSDAWVVLYEVRLRATDLALNLTEESMLGLGGVGACSLIEPKPGAAADAPIRFIPQIVPCPGGCQADRQPPRITQVAHTKAGRELSVIDIGLPRMAAGQLRQGIFKPRVRMIVQAADQGCAESATPLDIGANVKAAIVGGANVPLACAQLGPPTSLGANAADGRRYRVELECTGSLRGSITTTSEWRYEGEVVAGDDNQNVGRAAFQRQRRIVP
ncbi:MAG: hypothetical protein HYV63_27515 [Candidatus Schekmanbacteria bacterium]|nr:hypothetical protein [Candidatus Schekmanbacteria bacterium]